MGVVLLRSLDVVVTGPNNARKRTAKYVEISETCSHYLHARRLPGIREKQRPLLTKFRTRVKASKRSTSLVS